MAPTNNISLNKDNCNLKYVTGCSCRPSINSQIIIYFDNRRLLWNFNADEHVGVMAQCTANQSWMIRAGCAVNKWYKRRVYIDPFPQVIIEEMDQHEIQEYLSQDSENNHVFSVNANPQDITMTVEN
jgi:hypothetical protein